MKNVHLETEKDMADSVFRLIHIEDSLPAPQRKPSLLKRGYLLVVSHNHLLETNKSKLVTALSLKGKG